MMGVYVIHTRSKELQGNLKRKYIRFTVRNLAEKNGIHKMLCSRSVCSDIMYENT